jgi:hypothetical protein
MSQLKLTTWLKVAIYTTPIALGGAAAVALVTIGIPKEMWMWMWVRYFGSVAVAHLIVWLPAIPAFRKAPELSALIWAIFSPIVGLGLFSILWWPFVWEAWMFGAIALILSYGLPIVASVLCAIILYRITRNEPGKPPVVTSKMTTPLELLQRIRRNESA